MCVFHRLQQGMYYTRGVPDALASSAREMVSKKSAARGLP